MNERGDCASFKAVELCIEYHELAAGVISLEYGAEEGKLEYDAEDEEVVGLWTLNSPRS